LVRTRWVEMGVSYNSYLIHVTFVRSLDLGHMVGCVVEVHIGGLTHRWQANAFANLTKKEAKDTWLGSSRGQVLLRGRKSIEAESPCMLQGRIKAWT